MIGRTATAVGIFSAAILLAYRPALATNKVPYPEVKVEVAEGFAPDDAFKAMRKKLTDAVARKDQAALMALVGPTFVWTYQGGPVEQFDMGRTAVENFKAVFGFRAPDADTDGGVEDGPFWDALQEHAEETALYQVAEAGNLVCGPVTAGIADEEAEQAARAKVETEEDPAEWYFTIRPAEVMKSPTDKGPAVAKVGTIAMPVLGSYPTPKEGEEPRPLTHVEVLLPSGKSGWVAKGAVRPLVASRLCYAKTPGGDWRIAAYDQSE